jgi:integrase
VTRPKQRTLGQVVDEYLAHKANEKKRSVGDDELILKRKILPAFGAETPLRKITREGIARFTKARLEQEMRPGHKVKAGTVANELSVFRHLLRLAQEWGYVAEVPKVKLPKRSEGRLRYLQSDEIARLLEACPESGNPHLGTIVVIALNTGMRRGEILGLEWDRVDLATARITLYRTKSGKPRGIPINTAVYDALIAFERDSRQRLGRLFEKANGAGWTESVPHSNGAPAGEDPGLPIPRPPAHLCVPCRDAGSVPGRAEGAARAFDPDDDPPLRPPVSDPPPGEPSLDSTA